MTDTITQLCAELAEAVGERERLRAAQDEAAEQLTEWCEAFGIPDDGSMLEMIEAHVEARQAIFQNLSAGAAKDGRIQDLAQTVEDALDEAYDRADAREALRKYLVSLGLPAEPVRLDDPNLWALYEALTPG